MKAALANPYLLAGQKNTTYLKVGLTGWELQPEDRPPVNVSLVIDRSSSMSGEKIVQAREAAKMAVQQLRSDDIVSIVSYNSNVQVLVPATKLTDKAKVLREIDQLEAQGSTALFAGVSKGAAELRKFLTQERVNRVILLSDGQANVGPKSPGELGELGEALFKEGISVSTIGLGLGYNEDLMVKLAMKSDGNHVFVEDEQQLAAVFQAEFGDILSVVAQEVDLTIRCADGIRPVRVLGRDADISGQEVRASLNQLYSGHEKYFILEIETLVTKPMTGSQPAADVTVRYADMATQKEVDIQTQVSMAYTSSPAEVEEKLNQPVMADAVLLLATERNQLAMQLRDQGEIERAKKVLSDNADYLITNWERLDSPQLNGYAAFNRVQSQKVDDNIEWGRQRKMMAEQQISNFGQIGHGGLEGNISVNANGDITVLETKPDGGKIPADSINVNVSGNIILEPQTKSAVASAPEAKSEEKAKKKAGAKAEAEAEPAKPAEDEKVGF